MIKAMHAQKTIYTYIERQKYLHVYHFFFNVLKFGKAHKRKFKLIVDCERTRV